MFQMNDSKLIFRCPVCNLKNCKCGFKSANRLDQKLFEERYEQSCFRCGSSEHSGLSCPHVDQQTRTHIQEYTQYIQEYTAKCPDEPRPYNHNTASNRPQCINCGSQRHCTYDCYFPVQNTLTHNLYKTEKQRTGAK